MKQLGKRILAMTVAFGLTASMLVSDLSVMQVNAAGSIASETEEVLEVVEETVVSTEDFEEEESVAEESTVELTTEEDSTEEESSVEETAETVTEEESVVEESAEETSVAETEEAVEVTTEEVLETEEEASTAVIGEEVSGNGLKTETYAVQTSDYKLEVQDGYLVNTGTEAPAGVVTIPAGTITISANELLFKNNTNVTKVVFEDDALTTIEAEAFFGSTIKELTIPSGVTNIGDKAFYSAVDLTKVTFKAEGAAIDIGAHAFENCISLSTLYTNKRIRSLGKQAFYRCTALSNDSNNSLDFTGMVSIGEKAFAKCTSLAFIILPDSLEVLEAGAFSECSALGTFWMDYYKGVNAVQLGDGVKVIGDEAFAGCTSLEEIELPAQVEALGSGVFNGDALLKTITVRNSAGEDGECAVALTYTSFPSVKGLTLYSYSGTVEDWVGSHTAYGVKYVSLYKEYPINISKTENGKIAADVKTAKKGKTVKLTITPNEGYMLRYGSLYLLNADNQKIDTFINQWDYTFTMPEEAVTVYGTFVESTSVEYGTALNLQSIKDASNAAIVYDEEQNSLIFSKPWQYVSIVVEGNNGGNNYPGYSELVFTSKDEKVATIDEYGVIRALAKGSTDITVALVDEEKAKVTKALTFTVDVGAATYVEDLTLSYDAPRAKKKLVGIDEEATAVGMDIIEYPYSWLKTSSRKIKVAPQGLDAEGDKLHTKYNWSSLDSAIAKPASKTTTTDTGSITVPKNALGETVVTVKANDGSKEPVQKQFIVRVINDTPRLGVSKISVDPQSVTGTRIDLVSVYGSKPDIEKITIEKKVVDKNGFTTYVAANDVFELVKTADSIYLKVQEAQKDTYTAGKSYTYKNKYYLHGTMEESGTEFYIAIPTLTICKKSIKPSVKMTGKINLFYNGTASLDKLGQVKVTQNQKDLKIQECYLVGKEKTNGVNTEDDGAFAENFTVNFDAGKQTITIVRTPGDEELSCYTDGKSKGKPVLAGILRIRYEGYENPFDVKITVPTQTSAPSYSLDVSKISLNSMASGQEYNVSFINKKTKKKEDLTENTKVLLESGTTDGLIWEDEDNFSFDTEDDSIHIKFRSVQKGKVILILRQSDWEDQSAWNKKSIVKATISVSATSKFPTAKLGKTTLTVNRACPDAADVTTLKLNQNDSVLMEEQVFEPTGNKRDEDLIVRYDSESGTVVAEIAEGGSVDKGTYSFACKPEFMFAESDTVDTAKKVTLKVKVIDSVPAIKLKSTTFTLNANCRMTDSEEDSAKYDYIVRDFSWQNLPAEYSDYTLSWDETITKTGNGSDTIGAGNVKVELDGENKKVKVYIASNSKRVGTVSYVISGLTLVNEDKEIPVKNLKITVKSIDKLPAVTVTAKGTINPLDPASSVVYTPKLSNINGKVTDVVILELDEDDSYLDEGTEHFIAEHDTATGKTTVKVKEGAKLENRSYKIQLFYELSNGEENSQRVEGTYKVAKNQVIKLKQSMPKISVDKKSATFYAGDKSRTQVVTVTKKSTAAAQITDIKFSSKTSKTLQNAFEIVDYNEESGEMILRLKNSAFIKQGVEQTLTFEIVCDGQLNKTTGTTFTLKVKVVK